MLAVCWRGSAHDVFVFSDEYGFGYPGETRPDIQGGNSGNVIKLHPEGYTLEMGTGFLPGHIVYVR